MNILNPYRFGGDFEPNVFIGGVGVSSITTPSDFATISTLSVGDIKNFQNDGVNVSFYADADYDLLNQAFLGDSEITYFIDFERLKTCQGQQTFYNQPISADGFRLFISSEVTAIGQGCFDQNVGGSKPQTLRLCVTPRITNLGGTVGNDGVFRANNDNLRFYGDISLQTNNGGSPDGDLTSNPPANGIVYSTNSNAPDAVGTITEDLKGGSFINISWSAPTSSNPVDRYVIFVDNAFEAVTDTNSYKFLSLTTSTTLNIKILTIDNQGNISPFSATQQFTTLSSLVLRDYIISYYKLDSNVNDSVGSNNGTPTNITYVSGVVNNSGNFNGSTSKILISSPVGLSFGNGTTDSPFTISFWIKSNDLSSNPRIFDKRNISNSSDKEYRVIIVSSLLSFTVFDDSSGANIGKRTINTIPLNTWVHFTLTYDGSSSLSGINIYINGSSETTTDIANGTYTAMESLGEPVTIGKDAQFTNTLSGQMDEIIFWSKELTQSEAATIYNEGVLGNPIR